MDNICRDSRTVLVRDPRTTPPHTPYSLQDVGRAPQDMRSPEGLDLLERAQVCVSLTTVNGCLSQYAHHWCRSSHTTLERLSQSVPTVRAVRNKDRQGGR